MSSSNIPHVVLQSSSNHHRMPVIGFGTASMSPPSTTRVAVLEAIKLGYRHFDTASIYGSEQPLGEAIAEALQLGLIGSRDELFITSKLWCTDNFSSSCSSSSTENTPPGDWEFPYPEEAVTSFDLKGVWKAMEECQKLGLTKCIGVSNFSCNKLENLLSFATIPPSINQVEMNPTWQQKKLKEYCQAKGIIITAYSPLGSTGCMWGSDNVVDNELLKEIAMAHGKSSAQVSLRWLYELGVTIAVKSYNKERMKQNLEIFDWSLNKYDNEKIDQVINQVEMNPTWQQKKLKEYCQAKGIIITAYSPLGSTGCMWGSDNVVDNELLKEIAMAHGKSSAQVSLRWLYELGVTIAVKSYNKERMKQNLEIFDWSLNKYDNEKIDQVKQHQLSKIGPTKFIVDLWDGEN
ncbi:hypothetical protein JHK87_042779 [Glycine soja]|nr:hypothetical protein JHK87_042779 [Glycine soja]